MRPIAIGSLLLVATWAISCGSHVGIRSDGEAETGGRVGAGGTGGAVGGDAGGGRGGAAAPHVDGAAGAGGRGGIASGGGGGASAGGRGGHTDADAGQGDSGGAGGNSTLPPLDGGAATCNGPCLEPLWAMCPHIGQSCTKAMSGTDLVQCLSNGVKQLISPVSGSSNRSMVTRKKANGDLCFTAQVVSGQTEDFSDAQGQPVARLEFTSSSYRFRVTCAGGGPITEVDLQSPECAGYTNEVTAQCEIGACTW